MGNPSAVPHRTGRRLLRQGVLSQPSHLNLDAWKQSAGVFPRRLDMVLRYSGCDTLQRARETFQTSIELIDPAQKPIQPPDTRRGEIKIFDPSSSSPIHLWSKSKISNLKSKSTDRFPQSTSLAKINRWMLWLAVFGRSNWLGRWSAGARKNAAMGEKSASLTKMVQQLRHSHRRLCCLWATPEYQSGARRRIAARICRLTVKVAVTCGEKHSRRCWLSILSCCGQVSHTK